MPQGKNPQVNAGLQGAVNLKHLIRISSLRAHGSLLLVMAALALTAIIPGRVYGAASHEGAAASQETRADFGDVRGKEWIITEVRSAGKTVSVDRKKLEAANMGGFYTISFNEGQANGQGAPNRYFAPYAAGFNQSLGISNIASTMMLSLIEPDGLKESDFFGFLNKVTRWNLKDGNLELYSTAGAGAETILVFSPR